MSPNALKKNFACLAVCDSLIVGFFPPSFLSNNLQLLLATGRPGLCTRKKKKEKRTTSSNSVLLLVNSLGELPLLTSCQIREFT